MFDRNNKIYCLKSTLRFWYRFNQSLNNLIRIDLFGLSLEVQEHSMSQHGGRHCTNVFTRDVISTTQYRACFATEYQKL